MVVIQYILISILFVLGVIKISALLINEGEEKDED